ncbi:MAG: PKD domain-containing protein [Bacteroidota bacterium]|nr:PKD domain-containing protein [Bacteroidota bacterium]
MKFRDTSSAPFAIAAYSWDFGDGGTSNQKNPSYTFLTDSPKNVKLTRTTANGCTATDIIIIRPTLKPKADFTADKRSGCLEDLNVQFTNFTNTGTVQADNWLWKFGDGATSTEENPVHRYDIKEGVYDVTLIAFNGGCSDTFIRRDYIEIFPPWAQFKIIQPVCSPDSVTLSDTSIGATSVFWKLGDGDTSSKRIITKKYAPGTYRIILYAYNIIRNCTDTFFRDLVVPQKLVFDFTQDNTSGCVPLGVQFDVSVSNPSNYTWLWDFGDGTSSTTVEPYHIFSKKGIFDVSLTATSADSCTRTVLKKKLISGSGADVKMTVSPVDGCLPLRVTLVDSSVADKPIIKREWDMGNGDIIVPTSGTTIYTYTKAPVNQNEGYEITLRITDSLGCTVGASQRVYPSMPKPVFSYRLAETCSTMTYQFTPLTNDTIGRKPLTYLWDFGDGNASTDEQPMHTYNVKGKYKVVFSLTDGNGCVLSAESVIDADLRYPDAAFTTNLTGGLCPPQFIEFTDMSVPGRSDIVSWEWDFGDGTRSNQQHPQKIYLIAGDFTIKLKITDAIGCVDSIVKPKAINIKGPIGTYTFNKTIGCVPLTVTFTATSKNASAYSWDMGDGNTRSGQVVNYTYGYADQFIPLLVLSDSFGCTYTLPPIDTIRVYDNPLAAFTHNGLCVNSPIQFTDLSAPVEGTLASWSWDFGDGSTSTQQDPRHTYLSGGAFSIRMIVANNAGCTDTAYDTVIISNIEADFITDDTAGCLGATAFFIDSSISDGTIESWYWEFGDGNISFLQNPSHTYANRGSYDVKLTIRDNLGCTATLIKPRYIIVGDTIPPPAPVIYRVTVVDDTRVQLDFQKYTDSEFGRYIIYRQNATGQFIPIDSTADINDTIFTDQGLNTLQNVYCYMVRVKNVCGRGFAADSRTHCTVELDAAPAINKADLNWTRYKGWSDVLRYEVYRENINQPGIYDRLGSVPGTDTVFTDTAVICYATHVYKIKAVENGGYSQESWSDTAAATPIYVPTIPPGEVVRATVEDNRDVLVEWNLIPGKKIERYHLERSEDGAVYIPLADYPKTAFSGVDNTSEVNRLSYYYRVRPEDSCGDFGPYSNIGKTILLKADTTLDLRPSLNWSAYVDWAEGVQYYDIELKQRDGSFVRIGRTQGNETVFEDNQTDLNTLPFYCYRVVAHRNGPATDPDRNIDILSVSNEACVPVKARIFIPNVFTPNFDSLNNVFGVRGMFIKEYNIRIYDRWGTRVFETNDLNASWDGTFKGHEPVMDAYKYIIHARGADNQIFFLNGWVTVLP